MDELEAEARTQLFCRGCGREKKVGLLVCWGCFKFRTDVPTLKTFSGTFPEWLKEVNRGS
jgi:hypothetical protein